MRAFLEQALQTLPKEGLFVCVAPAPLVSLDSFLLAPLSGEALLWRSPSEEWSFSGFGGSARVSTRGSQRFVEAQREAQKLLQSITLRAHPLCQSLPSLRLFGGASFQPCEESPPWQDFADADFILPRWLYGQNKERAFIALAVSVYEDVSSFLEEARELENFLESLTDPSDRPKPSPTEQERAWGRGRSVGEGGESSSRVRSRGEVKEQPRSEWSSLVHCALSSMQAKEIEKVVLARQSLLTQAEPFSLSEAARRMLTAYPNCTQFIISRGGSSFIGASPERLVSRFGAEVEIDALAGSAPRTFGEEEQASQKLLQDDKERREHDLVIQGIQEALRPFCSSIQKPAQPQIKVLPNVLHLHTPLKAKLKAGSHILELVDALHPTPAVCGLPKEAARQWIVKNEPFSRGWYAAPVGYFDARGDGAFFVAIRSALVQKNRAWLFVGAGLVEGSEPDKEYDETAAKQKPMLSALGVL